MGFFSLPEAESVTTPMKAKSPKERIANHLGRDYVLFISANGAVFIRERMDPAKGGLLPFFSTDTHKAAEMIRIRHCHLGRQDPIYYVNDFVEGDLDSLEAATALFAETYADYKARSLYGLDP